jgi:hypothetical protein
VRKRELQGRRRKNRPRPTPKWLLNGEDMDRVAKARCLMVLSVLSGETPVTDAITTAGVSRGTYYQLERRALNGMLKALMPGAKEEGEDSRPAQQILRLESKVRKLEQARRRSERLLALTRKVVRGPGVSLGRTSSTRRGASRSRSSRRMEAGRPNSSLMLGGVVEP